MGMRSDGNMQEIRDPRAPWSAPWAAMDMIFQGWSMSWSTISPKDLKIRLSASRPVATPRTDATCQKPLFRNGAARRRPPRG
jgi:hypothetical protein